MVHRGRNSHLKGVCDYIQLSLRGILSSRTDPLFLLFILLLGGVCYYLGIPSSKVFQMEEWGNDPVATVPVLTLRHFNASGLGNSRLQSSASHRHTQLPQRTSEITNRQAMISSFSLVRILCHRLLIVCVSALLLRGALTVKA